MKLTYYFAVCVLVTFFACSTTQAQDVQKLIQSGKLIVDDNFDRKELGKQWSNNDARAQRTSKVPKDQFVPQSQLENNILTITRTKGSDHAVSCKTDAKFKDAVFQLKFRLTGKDKFGLNLNDPNLKTVHAGHICRVEIGPHHILIQDQKLGTMDLENRKLRQEGTADEKKAVAEKIAKFQKRIKAKIAADQWHDLTVVIKGNTIKVHIDGKPAAEFTSPGLGHATKANMALAVPAKLEVDDLRVWSLVTGG